jgi:flagellum-specific peptidoglycan hydrolase FlgJ
MLLKIFKTNWFSIALVCIVLLAIVRKGVHINIGRGNAPATGEKVEKFTDNGSGQAAGTTMGLVPDLNAHPAGMDANAGVFVKRFAQVAISEKKKFGIPASIILAAACVNSSAGQRAVCQKTNNFFALPCDASWEGATVSIDNHCYRRYETPWESFRDFSIHLSGQEWYGALRKSAGRDWQAWVNGIRVSDISDVPNCREEMTRMIRTFQLDDLDRK